MQSDSRSYRSVLHGLAIWLVIGGCAAFAVFRQASRPASKVGEDVQGQLQARYLVGLGSFGFPRDQLCKQAVAQFSAAPVRRAILLGELDSPTRAMAELPADEKLLRRLYEGEELSAQEQEALLARRGWFGRLALATMKEGRASVVAGARRTVVAAFALALLIVGGILAGLVLLVLVAVLAVMGHLPSRITEGRSLVYGETFAAYMLLYLALGFGLKRVPVPADWSLGLSGLGMLGSLLALAWPVVRGVPWQTMKADLGLEMRPLLDIAAGFATYVAALPLLAVGAALMFALTALQRHVTGAEPVPPSHPLAGVALRAAPWWVWAQVFLVAAVLAPLVEELFFRGALYLHLHRMGVGWHRFARFVFATGASCFVFAVIHPQGWLAVPALSGLAAAFCLARELRGSLLPGMVAHGLNNGVITLMLLLAIA